MIIWVVKLRLDTLPNLVKEEEISAFLFLYTSSTIVSDRTGVCTLHLYMICTVYSKAIFKFRYIAFDKQ